MDTINIESGVVSWLDLSRANDSEAARVKTVADIAAISYGREAAKDPERLYATLIKRGHESPLEFVHYCDGVTCKNLRAEAIPFGIQAHNFAMVGTVRLEVPIFVARQIMRHRACRYLELSRRYVKPGRVKYRYFFPEPIAEANKLVGEIERLVTSAVKDGARHEALRAYLPLGLMTTFYMQCDYRGWFNFFVLRTDKHAQKETREAAESILVLFMQNQEPLVKRMTAYADRWVTEVNPIFKHAREHSASRFIELLTKIKQT